MSDYKLNFYDGAEYTMQPKYREDSASLSPFIGYQLPSSAFGFPSNPQTANQIDAVSKKISTGTKTVEVSGVNIGGGEGAMGLLDNIPKQHFKEINRLKKLAGVDLTFHGPLVEATGISRQGWDPTQRMQAERQMSSAVERAHDLGNNTIVTFHASNGLPEPETLEYDAKTKKETLKQAWVVDERTGSFQNIGPPQKDFLTGQTLDPYEEVKKRNKEAWDRELQQVSFHAYNGSKQIEGALKQHELPGQKKPELDEKQLLKFYKDFYSPETQNELKKLPPEQVTYLTDKVHDITHGNLYLRDAYSSFRNLYDKAYSAAEKASKSNNQVKSEEAQKSINQLESFRKEIAHKLKGLNDPTNMVELSGEIIKGIDILRSISTPQTLTPLREFAIDKASDTFGNVAIEAYKKFKGDAPIISIENPPAGCGLSRAQDLKEVVEASRKKFVDNAKEMGLSKEKAREEAEKLIGVTWDVGHINMIRKHGFGTEQLKKETQIIAPFVKHIHLSDNFGLEHTELPMGMGNVPIKEHEEILKKQFGEKFKQIKQIVETGSWFRNFNNVTPFAETLEAFGSPLYPMKMGSYWNSSRTTGGGYGSGYGTMLPSVNFSTYGAGFSQLPSELGGQAGGGRSRMAGTPNE